MEFEEFNCFFIDFLRYSFGRKKVFSIVVEREYTPDKTWQICFAYQLTGFCMIRGFTEWYFLTDYSYILENHFYFVNAPYYCFKPSLSRIFCVNSSVNNRKKEIGFVAKLFSKYFFVPKVIPRNVFISSQIQEPS